MDRDQQTIVAETSHMVARMLFVCRGWWLELVNICVIFLKKLDKLAQVLVVVASNVSDEELTEFSAFHFADKTREEVFRLILLNSQIYSFVFK